jgi:hypothetical protein
VFAPLQSLIKLRLWGCLSITAFSASPRKHTISSDAIPTGTAHSHCNPPVDAMQR